MKKRKIARNVAENERHAEFARTYEGYNTRIEWHSTELATLVSARALPPGRALDLGCGHGTESIFLAAMGWHVIGVDLGRNEIAAAEERADRALTKTARARLTFQRRNALGFHDPDPFDLVIERLLFQNLDARLERHGFIDTVASVLKLQTGVLVMRTASSHDDRCRVATWGRISRSSSSYTKSEEVAFERYFTMGPEIGFTALVTDPIQSPGALIVTTVPLAIRVMRRNASSFRRRRQVRLQSSLK